MDIVQLIVGSSTPDGLAPLNQQAIVIFSIILSTIPLLWATANLIMLIDPKSQAVSETQNEIFNNLSARIIHTALIFLKYNFSVALVAGLIFFLIIFGAIQNFQSSEISLSYLWGLLQGIVVGIAVALVSLLGLNKMGAASVKSIQDVHWSAKLVSNFVSYLVCGVSLLVMCTIFVFGRQDQNKLEVDQIKAIGKKLISFAFGVSTVAIGTKINSVLYGKGSQSALSMIVDIQPTLQRDYKNSIVVCKAVGENVRKVVSNAIDYNMYFCMSMAGAVIAGGLNIIGADQHGQIIFDLSGRNLYLPLIALLFMLTISFVVSLAFLFLFNPSSGDEVALVFKRQIYVIIILMSGFLALASYLCLPVQFYLKEQPNILKNPNLAYLCLLISLFALFILNFMAEFQVNHPKSVYSVIFAGSQSVASTLLAGFQSGWLGSALPILFWAGLTYLGQYWLGSFGVSLIAVGTALLIPTLLSANTFYSLSQNCSFAVWIGQLGEQAIAHVMEVSENRKMFQVQIHSHFTSMALTINYSLILNYINIYELSHISLMNPGLYVGLFIGAMFIYSFGAAILLCIQNVSPILCYDAQAQMQELPAIRQKTAELNLQRSSSIFTLNTVLQLKFFLPYLFFPFLIVGLAFGPKMALGMIIGMLLGGLQLAFSSGLTGNLWNAARTEVFLGRVELQQGQKLKSDSQQGRGVDLSNQIGNRTKDAIGSCLHGFISFTALTNAVMGSLYASLHTD